MALDALQVATGSLADLGYIEEASFGKVPASPPLKVCRRRSTTIGLTKETYDSEEVRADRQQSDSRHGIRRAGGDIVTEISPGGHADFYEALLGGNWAAPATINVATGQSPVTINNNGDGTVDFTGPNFTTSVFLIGDTLTFASTGQATLDGKVFTLIGIDGSNNGIMLPWNGYFAAATLPFGPTTTGTLGLSGKKVSMGNIYRSFTMERAFTDLGKFEVISGLRANSAAIDLPATGIATATFNFIGKNAAPLSSTSIDGSAAISSNATTHTSLTFSRSAGTITAAAGSFVTVGYAVGDKIAIDGTGITDPQNRNIKTITAVTALVLTVAEAINDGGPYTTPFTITRVGAPAYTAAPTNQVLAAVSGVLVAGGVPVATVTEMSLNIDNQMEGSEVVGANTIPVALFGLRCMVSGSLTILLDLGGVGEAVYNAFDLETEMTLILRLDSSDATKAVTFALPRVKINAGSIGDAEVGLPVEAEFRALLPGGGKLGTSQIVIGDSAAV